MDYQIGKMNSTSDGPQRESEVVGEMGRMDLLTAKLEKQCSDLFGRLESVIVGSGVEGASLEKAAILRNSPLGQRLQGINNKLNNLSQALEILTAKIEL